MHNLLSIPIAAITSLTAEGVVTLLRSILRAECQYGKLGPSALTITEKLTVADGGIDAEVVADHDTPIDCLFQKGVNGFQLKSGGSFKPWTVSSIKGELLNSRGKLFDEVDRLVRRKGKYVLISTGHDLTPEQRNDAKKHIVQVLSDVGHAGYDHLIEVLGASQVAEFVERYPSITSSLTLTPIEDALAVDEWRRTAHMSNLFVPSNEQTDAIEKIRTALRGDAKHVRLLGEPGLGKSRLALETVRNADIAPTVLYIEHGSRFGQTKLFRYLLRSPCDKPMVLVIDELPEPEMMELWAHLKTRCGSLKLITLDHGRDETHDHEIQRLMAPRLPDETIKGIIARHVGDSHELNRWVQICDGSPRVAQAVAENLRANPGDLLRPPSTVPLWERFLHGYGRRNEQQARQIDCVARHLALFSRFGYEYPVSSEAQYIADLIGKADPTIGWARFQEIVRELRARRVLQGSRTLFFVPRALHIYLWKQYWESYGRGFDFPSVFASMPESLHVWFMSMFKFADETATNGVVGEILRHDGIFADKAILKSEKGSRFLSTLAEANTPAVLMLLEETVGKWSDKELLAFTQSRQNIVWTLEKIAVWKPYVIRAMLLLAKLAVNETAKNSNNATGTLLGLFGIGFEWAATEATPAERHPAVIRLMRSNSDADRRMALRVMKSALNTRGMGHRIVGPEYQGLKSRANLWKPQTYGEQWAASYLYFKSLIDETRGWPSHLLPVVCETVLNGISQQLKVPPCTELAIQELERLSCDPAMDSSKLNKFFFNWFEYDRSRQVPDQNVGRRLAAIRRNFTRRSLFSRLQKYVIDVDWVEWDDDFRAQRNKSKKRAKALAGALAKRIALKPQLFDEISHLLTPQKDGPALHYFGSQIAANDQGYKLLEPITQLTIKAKHSSCLAGYLSTVRQQSSDVYLRTIRGMLAKQDEAWLGALLSVRNGYDDELFVCCLDALEKNWVEPNLFLALQWGMAWQAVPAERTSRLLKLLRARGDGESLSVLINLLDDLPFDDASPFDPAFVFEIATQVFPEQEDWGDVRGYAWKTVCEKLVRWDNTYAVPLIDAIFKAMKTAHHLSYDSYVQSVANDLVKIDPSGSWAVLAKHFEATLPKWRSDLQSWLKGGLGTFDEDGQSNVITEFPLPELLLWIEKDPMSRAPLIAHAAPRTLDEGSGGILTRELLTRYSTVDGVGSGISAIFHSGGYTGPTSAYLKRRRDKFRSWLASGFTSEVIQWIERELNDLDKNIEGAEISEERDRFS